MTQPNTQAPADERADDRKMLNAFAQAVAFGTFDDRIRTGDAILTALQSRSGQAGVPDAMKVVTEAMRTDLDYAWSWHCNVAMAAFDEGMPHYAANKAAARFMRSLADVDTTRHPGFPPKPDEGQAGGDAGGQGVAYRCADCKAPLRPGYTCDACDSFEAEEIPEDRPPAAPASDQNTIKSIDRVVRVCPTKDIVCGDRSSNWCATCPNQNTIKKQPAAPALVPLDARRIAQLAFEMCSACYSGMDHQFAGMTIVKFAQAVQADFCRINGLTVGDGGV